MGKTSKNKWKSFKKTLRLGMEKRASMEHQSPSLWGVGFHYYKMWV
jgi:hypothetical protein